jgi:uncharacterized protein (UPF0305 family)
MNHENEVNEIIKHVLHTVYDKSTQFQTDKANLLTLANSTIESIDAFLTEQVTETIAETGLDDARAMTIAKIAVINFFESKLV